MSIASEITRLQNIKSDIRTALGNKGIDASTHNYADFANDIGNIQNGVSLETLNVTENGTVNAPTGKAYSSVTVDVFQMESYVNSITEAFYPGQTASEIPLLSFPKRIKLNLPQCKSIAGAFRQYIASAPYASGIEEVELTLTRPCQAQNFLNRNTTVKKVSFPNGLTITGGIYYFISGNTALEEVIGEISILPGITYDVTTAFQGTNLKTISFAHNTLYFPNTVFASPVLTDESLVSIANGLNPTVSGASLSLHATPKANLSLIVGTVADGVFTQDAGGTVTLTDFITQTKGWTLA